MEKSEFKNVESHFELPATVIAELRHWWFSRTSPLNEAVAILKEHGLKVQPSKIAAWCRILFAGQEKETDEERARAEQLDRIKNQLGDANHKVGVILRGIDVTKPRASTLLSNAIKQMRDASQVLLNLERIETLRADTKDSKEEMLKAARSAILSELLDTLSVEHPEMLDTLREITDRAAARQYALLHCVEEEEAPSIQ